MFVTCFYWGLIQMMDLLKWENVKILVSTLDLDDYL